MEPLGQRQTRGDVARFEQLVVPALCAQQGRCLPQLCLLVLGLGEPEPARDL